MLSRRALFGSALGTGVLNSVPFASAFASETSVPMKDFLADLEELVKIDSKSGYAEGVRRIADVMEKRFDSIGWTVSRYEVGQCGPGLVITNHPDQTRYDVILCAHMDTVQPVGNAAQYPLKVEGKFAHGAGAGDDKASLNAVWWICKDLPTSVTKKLRMCVLLSPAEEVGPQEHKDFILEYGKRAKLALVYEPGRPDGSFVKARKSCNWIKLEFHGVSAHAGNNPQDGRNAVNAMAEAIPQINAIAKDYKDVTINAGVVKGGTVPNTVPDYAEVTFDLRTLKNEDIQAVLSRVEALTKKGFGRDVKTTMTITSTGYSMEYTEASAKLAAIIDRAALELGQKKPVWLTVGGASDGNSFSGAGLGVVDAMGVCSGNLHNPEKEFVDLTTVTPRVRLGRKVLELLAQAH